MNKDKRFLVLGATSGIGRALTLKLIDEGFKVFAIGRSIEKLEDLSNKINNKNLDFRRIEILDFEGFVEEIGGISKSYGPFNGIFNSVGVERFKSIKMVKQKDIDIVFNPLFNSTLALIKLSLKRDFLEENGSIVLMSSVSAVTGKAGMGLYASARGAIESLTKSAAHELGSRNKRINIIRAGSVVTEMHQRIISNLSDNQINKLQEDHILGFGGVDDIISMALYLFGHESKWITGSIINVDGGYLS